MKEEQSAEVSLLPPFAHESSLPAQRICRKSTGFLTLRQAESLAAEDEERKVHAAEEFDSKVRKAAPGEAEIAKVDARGVGSNIRLPKEHERQEAPKKHVCCAIA
mmetsp:Transcript_31006/g.89616  ORF Transcript_31006/g.89616 Transcript_31006/m.89616 type:complete len:105 (-) Transcript_31006:106-420(-)